MQKFDGKNPGGLKELYILQKSDMTTLPLAVNLLISTDITTAADFEQVEFIPSTGRHSERRSDDANGDIYQQQVTCLINQDRLALGQALFTYQNRDIIALIVDHNGSTRMIGSKEEPARMSFELVKEGPLAGSTNMYTLTITANTTTPAPWYTGTFTSSV